MVLQTKLVAIADGTAAELKKGVQTAPLPVAAAAEPVRLRAAQVCAAFSLSEKQVSHMFLIGSRLWMTHKPGSDYDLLIVLDGNGQKQKGKDKVCCHASQYDAIVMSSDEFRKRLEAHEFLMLVVASLEKGNPNVIMGDPRSLLSSARFTFDKQKMFSVTTKDVGKDWKKARKFIDKGKLVEGKKILCHAMRSLHIALCLMQTAGADVGDLHVCSDLHMQLQSMYDKAWIKYDGFLCSQRDRLIFALQKAMRGD